MKMATNDKPVVKTSAIPEISLIHPDCAKRISPITITAITGAPDNNEPVVPDGKGFMFDIIVVRLDIQKKTVKDPSKLTVDVNFNGNNLSITSSRINVLDFKAGRSLEFVANPLTLRDELTTNPLIFKVADADSVLGYGTLKWPEQFLFELIECEGEMIDSIETEIKECDGTINGTIQVIVRLQPKCEEYVDDSSPNDKCRNANKEIHPNDILFVVGEDKNPCCCSQIEIIPASDYDQLLNPNCLDLSNFRAVNSQTVKNTNILTTLDPACQELKAVKNDCQQLINPVMVKKKSMTCCTKQQQCQELKQFEKYSAPLDFGQRPSFSSTDSYNPIPCRPLDSGVFADTNIIQITHKESPPNLVVNEPDVYRNCPLCKENMSFLPRLATCPNCCYKPVPYFEEKPYNNNQTADQIIKDYINTNSGSDVKNDHPTCRCTHAVGKTCAHCRIKRLCEDVYQPSPAPQPKYSESKSSAVKCVSSSDNRPYLSRVFSELRDFYDIKDPKKKEFEPHARCENELNKGPAKHSLSKKTKADQPKNESEEAIKHCPKIRKHRPHTRKRLVKPSADTAVKRRLYDYQTVRQNHATHIGHKTCINGFAGRKNVPPNMGWLWNAENSGVHAKWKPGAIRKPIKELMRHFLKDFPADTLLVSQYSYRKNGENKDKNDAAVLVQMPTLHISKNNGEYIITMRPLKDAKTLKEAADPYENMKPVQFRITKNPKILELRKLKQCLKDMGFNKCTCHMPIVYCICRSFLDKKNLEYLCNKECRKRNLSSCIETLVLSDTSESEEELDFAVTPPAGVIKPERLRKPNFVNAGTQYLESDWNPIPLFPKAPNKYIQMCQLAVEERKGGKASSSGGVYGDGGANRVNGAGGIRSSLGTGGGKEGFRHVMTGGVATDFKFGGRVPSGRGIASQGAVGQVPAGRIPGSRKPTEKDEVPGGMRSSSYPGGKGAIAGGKGGFRRALTDGLATGFSGKYDARVPVGRGIASRDAGGQVSAGRKPAEKDKVLAKKVADMMKYMIKTNKMFKISPEAEASKRKEKMRLLRGVNPPLLCMVDRRGKPFDPCTPCFPCGDNRIC